MHMNRSVLPRLAVTLNWTLASGEPYDPRKIESPARRSRAGELPAPGAVDRGSPDNDRRLAEDPRRRRPDALRRQDAGPVGARDADLPEVPGTTGLTRFSGTPAPPSRTSGPIFSSDVLPAPKTRQGHFRTLNATSKIDFLGPLVLVIGIITLGWGLLMVMLVAQRAPASIAG